MNQNTKIAQSIVGSNSDGAALVLDCFSGSGTVAGEAARNRRRYLGFELNEDYLDLSIDRATVQVEMF
jgi:DNA modification methylase